MVGATVGRYRILAKLGEGGMGSVWKAEDPLLGRSVALKFLADALTSDRDARARFLREARAASTLEHPGIATVFDTGEADGKTFIAFQLVDGETVAAKVQRGALALSEAVRMAVSAADALHYAHEHGVLHRDVTSRNIMVARDGRVIVVDFGLALPEGHTRVTQSGAAMGTAPYMAPEIALGENADRRSDVYGLGVVLYEMVAGRLPFKGERLQAVLYAAVHTPAQPPSKHREQIPMVLDAITLKALSKSPGERHQSAKELASELRALARSGVLGSAEVISGEAGAEVVSDLVDSERRAPPQSEASTQDLRRSSGGRPHGAALTPTPSTPSPRAASSEPPALTPAGTQPRRLSRVVLIVGTLILGGLTLAVLRMTGVIKLDRGGSKPLFASVAVLPLKNSSDDPNLSNYLADGIGENLTTKLTQGLGVRVTPWVTAQRYSDQSRPFPDIAKELNVEALLIGTFRKAGNRLQGTVSLVEAKTGQQVWAEEFDEASTDLFTVQKQIAVGAATKLKGKLNGKEAETLARPAAQSLEAYDFYLKGSNLLHREDRESVDSALAYFNKAVQIEPTLAETYVGIGAVHTTRYVFGWEGGYRNLEIAEENFKHALRLNPSLLAAHRGLVRVYQDTSRGEECLQVGKVAGDLGGDQVESLLVRAEAYTLCGLPEKAIPLLERAIELDPANEAGHYFGVLAECWSQRFQDAIEAAETYFREFGDDPEIDIWVGVAYQALGDPEPARAYYEKSIARFGEDPDIQVYWYAATNYWRMGQPEMARKTVQRALDIAQRRLQISPDNPDVRGAVAVLQWLLGKRSPVDKIVLRRVAHILALIQGADGEAQRAIAMLRECLDPWCGSISRANDFQIRFFDAGKLENTEEFQTYLKDLAEAEARLRARY